MSGLVVRNYILLKMADNSLQHGEICAFSCLRYLERSIEFQYGTAVYYVFITGLNARKISAETSKRRSTQGRSLARRDLEHTLDFKGSDNLAWRDPSHDLPQRLQEFTEHLVNGEASTTEAADS